MKKEKLCVFYASNYHLSLILLEYLKNKEANKYSITTFLQNNISDEVNMVRRRYQDKFDKISTKIEFNENKKIDNTDIKDNSIIIIEGDIKYIKKVKKYLEGRMKNKVNNVKIVSCFNFEEQKEYMDKILKDNDKILYTTGEKIID